VGGGGSGNVVLPYCVTPLQAINGYIANVSSKAKVTYNPSNPLSNAVQAAKNADVAIVFVACTSSEGSDRGTLVLPDNQDNLVQSVVQAQPNTIVVVHSPGAVLMPWVNNVRAVLAAFLPGQEDGNAIADILFGKVNPSGRLPLTFPNANSQTPINTPAQYPGVNDQSSYSEGLLVGYRWYDAKNETPLFPFGHGLSYSAFDYSNLIVSGKNPVSVSVTITNSGKYSGSEVAQLYINFPTSAGEPPSILRRFKKVSIAAGQSAKVTFDDLVSRDFSIWDVGQHNWKIVNGNFGIFVGSTSRDFRQKGTVQI